MDAHQKKVVDAFMEALAQSGYSSNANLEVKILDAGGSVRAQEQNLRDLLLWPSDVIFSLSAEGTLMAKSQTPAIPVVFSGISYPMELGLVERLEFSSNQMVGIKCYVPVEEQLAFLLRLIPGEVRRLGVCLKAGARDSKILLKEIRDLAVKQGMEVMRIEATDASSLMRALAEAGPPADAFYLACDDFLQGDGARLVIDHATRRGIPVMSCGQRAVERGALAGAVVDEEAAARMAAAQAAQILGGRTPTSLQTLTASPPKLMVNRSAARSMGLRIPPTFLGENVFIYE